MSENKRLALIKEVGEEIITEEDLKKLVNSKKKLSAYDGFEPSGNPHIAQGILRAINVNKMIKAGVKFKMYAADWHAWANNKFGGDLEKIQTAGDYLVEVWKASGMEVGKVEFIRASEVVDNEAYWRKVMQIARLATVKRIIRCGQIMGRDEREMLQSSQIIYPCMQAADIFEFDVDICQLGMDQRKVNVLARELAAKLGYKKPVVVSHHMLMGLGKPMTSAKDVKERAIDLKMSKSKPQSAIFMTDSEKDVKRKIGNAYCPAKIVKENPVLEYCKYIIFEKIKNVKVERDKKFGGDVNYKSYSDLERDYAKGKLHPLDLKKAVSGYVNCLLDPVRKHFDKNKKARELFNRVKKFKVTR